MQDHVRAELPAALGQEPTCAGRGGEADHLQVGDDLVAPQQRAEQGRHGRAEAVASQNHLVALPMEMGERRADLGGDPLGRGGHAQARHALRGTIGDFRELLPRAGKLLGIRIRPPAWQIQVLKVRRKANGPRSNVRDDVRDRRRAPDRQHALALSAVREQRKSRTVQLVPRAEEDQRPSLMPREELRIHGASTAVQVVQSEGSVAHDLLQVLAGGLAEDHPTAFPLRLLLPAPAASEVLLCTHAIAKVRLIDVHAQSEVQVQIHVPIRIQVQADRLLSRVSQLLGMQMSLVLRIRASLAPGRPHQVVQSGGHFVDFHGPLLLHAGDLLQELRRLGELLVHHQSG
mmetsp:Transcript_16627/g.63237  ORF Transcript_16627/g.63237 Transcript_16627/m.63237 type:complete len:345 (+) Transcript_16627:1948-2982(+)